MSVVCMDVNCLLYNWLQIEYMRDTVITLPNLTFLSYY